jgi:hypothetical protein
MTRLCSGRYSFENPLRLSSARVPTYSLFAAVCCGCNPAAAAASTVFFSLWIAAAAIQTAATVSACSQPNTPLIIISYIFKLHSINIHMHDLLKRENINPTPAQTCQILVYIMKILTHKFFGSEESHKNHTLFLQELI